LRRHTPQNWPRTPLHLPDLGVNVINIITFLPIKQAFLTANFRQYCTIALIFPRKSSKMGQNRQKWVKIAKKAKTFYLQVASKYIRGANPVY
jgi:hypothetical protein